MTAAFILAALFLLVVGFIAGALWERRRAGRVIEYYAGQSDDNLTRAVRAELLANNLGAENMMLRHHIDETGKVLPPRREKGMWEA